MRSYETAIWAEHAPALTAAFRLGGMAAAQQLGVKLAREARPLSTTAFVANVAESLGWLACSAASAEEQVRR